MRANVTTVRQANILLLEQFTYIGCIPTVILMQQTLAEIPPQFAYRLYGIIHANAKQQINIGLYKSQLQQVHLIPINFVPQSQWGLDSVSFSSLTLHSVKKSL